MAKKSKTRNAETRKLQAGLGFLIRYSPNGAWTWRHWNRRRDKWASKRTGEVNLSAAKQWGDSAGRLTIVAQERSETPARPVPRGCQSVRRSTPRR